jgi:hypothetical protein
MRELNKVKTTIRIIKNRIHPTTTNNMTLNCAQSDVKPATSISARKRPAYWRKNTHTIPKFTQTVLRKKKELAMQWSGTIKNKEAVLLATKYNLHRRTIGNHNSHSLDNERFREKNNRHLFIKYTDSSPDKKETKNPKTQKSEIFLN